MALLRERMSGTLDRQLAIPVRRSEIVYGYMISYGLISIIQATIIVLATIWLLKIEVVGNIAAIIFICVLLALVALAFGILLSTLANSEFQMMQFLPIVIFLLWNYSVGYYGILGPSNWKNPTIDLYGGCSFQNHSLWQSLN